MDLAQPLECWRGDAGSGSVQIDVHREEGTRSLLVPPLEEALDDGPCVDRLRPQCHPPDPPGLPLQKRASASWTGNGSIGT